MKMRRVLGSVIVAVFVGVLTTSTVAVFHNSHLDSSAVDQTGNPFYLAY